MRIPDPHQLPVHGPPEALKLRVVASARQQPSPARTSHLWQDLARVGLAVAAMLAVLMLFGGPEHAAGRPAVSGSWILAGVLAQAIAATWLSLPPRRSMLPPARRQLLAVAIGVPLLTGAWLVLWHPTYADPFIRTGLRCFALTALTAPWPFMVLTRASRRLDPRHPSVTGAALGAAAGAWAAVMLELWCPLASAGHVLLGHVLPLAVLSLAGAVYGARRLGLRRVR